MMFDSFPSKMLESGMDATWLNMRLHLDNVANYETPGYKAQQMVVGESLRGCNSPKHGGKHNKTFQAEFLATIFRDEKTEARVDGNNVSMEKEQLELFKAQAQYSYMAQKITGHYQNIITAIQNTNK